MSVVDAAGLHVRSGSLSGSSVWGFSDVGLDAAHTRLQIVLAKSGAPLARLLPAGALAVVNGGYFEPDFRPSTWLKDHGIELSPKSDTSKGGVLALGAGRMHLGTFAELGFEPELVVQSFPLIVEPGGKAGIHSDDGRRAARTVACLVGSSLHFIVISAPRGDGPTLFESAALLREAPPRGFGCTVALNFDGGPSSGVWFAPQVAAKQREPFANVGYAIAILPR
ncbi:MAG TPA: phosphodiester glycosidase family protein [Polyangiaceae bacterium]|nr:phosphodiester glycosidase family protein [Polyangiaceae bacterium]